MLQEEFPKGPLWLPKSILADGLQLHDLMQASGRTCLLSMSQPWSFPALTPSFSSDYYLVYSVQQGEQFQGNFACVQLLISPSVAVSDHLQCGLLSGWTWDLLKFTSSEARGIYLNSEGPHLSGNRPMQILNHGLFILAAADIFLSWSLGRQSPLKKRKKHPHQKLRKPQTLIKINN